MLDSWAVIY